MSSGKIVTLGGTRAASPKKVYISDGTVNFPWGHYEYFTRTQPDGMLLLNLNKSEYSEFKVDSDRNFSVNLWNQQEGARYKLFILRTTNVAITVSFENETHTQTIKGVDTPTIVVLDVEVAKLNEAYISIIGGQQNTDNITLSKDIVFNGVEQGGYANGSQMNQGDTLTAILTKMAQNAIAPIYIAPVFGITPNAQSVEAGTMVNPTIAPSLVLNDAGPLNRYLLQLSIAGGAFNSLVDLAVLQNYDQAAIQISDGQYLNYLAQAYYDEGITKNNNLGTPDPTNKILAGSKSDNLIYTGYRKLFYGVATPMHIAVNSVIIRGLANSYLNPVNGTQFTINITAGTEQIIFAYPNTLREVSSVKYEELGNAEVKDTFTLISFSVLGANDFAGISYKVYIYAPAVPFSSAATYKVTI